MKTILEINGLKKTYGNKENITKALDGVTFQVMEGEFVGIMGSSGSGKSTLLNCIATVIRATEGSIVMEGKEVGRLKGQQLADYRGNNIGYIFQNFELLENMTAKENIMLPLAIHGLTEKDGGQRLKQLANYLEIEEVLNKFPAQMSGGQKQRIAAARALILNPKLVLADEPTGALDSKNARMLMNKLSGLVEEQRTTILMVTHDSAAASFCSRILFIQDGMIYHEIRRQTGEESREEFYERILNVMAELSGGGANVL